MELKVLVDKIPWLYYNDKPVSYTHLDVYKRQMLPIAKVAENLGIDADDLEFYGKYKAKLSDELIEKCKNCLLYTSRCV